MDNKRAFIFPAFISEFTHQETDFLKQNSFDINHYLQRISKAVQVDLPGFSYNSEEYLSSELNSQLLAYAFSCSFNDILLKKNINPDYIAGYSMGIYAAFYSAESISFEDGARLIYKAFNLVSELTQTKEYGMGAIIGLSFQDVLSLINDNKLNLEIININNEHSLVVAGLKNEVLHLLNVAKEEGALSTAELTVNTPYHSKYLIKFTDRFTDYLESLDCKQAQITWNL